MRECCDTTSSHMHKTGQYLCLLFFDKRLVFYHVCPFAMLFSYMLMQPPYRKVCTRVSRPLYLRLETAERREPSPAGEPGYTLLSSSA